AIQHPSVISKLLGQAAARLTAFDWQNGVLSGPIGHAIGQETRRITSWTAKAFFLSGLLKKTGGLWGEPRGSDCQGPAHSAEYTKGDRATSTRTAPVGRSPRHPWGFSRPNARCAPRRQRTEGCGRIVQAGLHRAAWPRLARCARPVAADRHRVGSHTGPS